MGYQDREYFRETGGTWYWRTSGSICRILVVINVIVFVIQVLTAPGLAMWMQKGQGFFTDALVMDPVAVFEHGQVWRLLTSFFLHSPLTIWHILFNMLVLWFFGPDMEDHYGPKEFLAFYLVAGLLSSLVWGLSTYFIDPLFLAQRDMPDEAKEMFKNVLGQRTALGASGAVTAVMILCAWHYPQRIITVLFISVPLWLVAVIYVGADFLVLYQGQFTGTGVAAHLTGAAFASLYFYFNWRIIPWTEGWGQRWKRLKRPAIKLHRPAEGRLQKSIVNDGFAEELDRVLAKLHEHGRAKLDADEIAILEQASKRYREGKK
jgi:membrane associated rhomboid family serine protease